jgi:Na+(H+)/acetate symporter ActP
MQFMVLFTGIMVFMFYQFTLSPVHFNPDNVATLQNGNYKTEYKQLEAEHEKIFEDKKTAIYDLIASNKSGDIAGTTAATNQVKSLLDKDEKVREEVKILIQKQDNTAEKKDDDYIFINFVLNHLPVGIIGLLVAVIFAAAMSSISAELNALGTTTIIDIYRRSLAPDKTDKHYLHASMFFTVLWGALALGFATVASLFDNLIEAVNIIGSLFYGVILGIFAVAFFFKRIGGTAVFYSALISEAIILLLFVLDKTNTFKLVYLWYNPIGCFLVILFAALISSVLPRRMNT